MNSFQGQKKLSSYIQNKEMKFELYSHSGDVEDMESFLLSDESNKARGRAIISKERITKNVKVVTKCLAFSLMLCSLRPNLSVAKVISSSVSPGTSSLTSAKRTGAIIRTVIIGGLVGVGAMQVLRQQKDFSLKEQLKQLMSIIKSKPDATTTTTTDDSTSSQEEEDAATKKKLQEDAEIMAAARIQEEKDRLAMEAETAKKEIEEALRKQKEEEDKMKKNLE